MRSAAPDEEAYRASGVDLNSAERLIPVIRDLARTTSRKGSESVGAFAALVSLSSGILLAASADGVGTKVEVARMTGRLDTVGIDCVAMCVNDLACVGADPVFFLDYLAMGRLEVDEAAAIVSGVAEGCRRAGCELVGGETAEHPGVLEEGRFDLAGFCVGVVEPDRRMGPERVRPGDELIGFLSSGLHSNGFSLVRRVILRGKGSLDEVRPPLGRSLGEELLEPTRIYVRPVTALAGAGLALSAAHVTGGGISRNLPRALPPDLGAVIDTSAWIPLPIFAVVAEAAGLRTEDAFGVLNMGIGMIVAVPRDRREHALELAGAEAVPIGRVVQGGGVQLR